MTFCFSLEENKEVCFDIRLYLWMFTGTCYPYLNLACLVQPGFS